MTAQLSIQTPVGELYLVSSDKGLQGVYQKKQAIPLLKSGQEASPAAQILTQAEKELQQYFSGQRQKFDVPLDIQGTEFQKKVWQQLSQIPYGKTFSYSDIASRIKKPKAMRAVGSANGKNPIWIIIPCHRVIAANGTLGGYAGGLPMKKKLLELESQPL